MNKYWDCIIKYEDKDGHLHSLKSNRNVLCKCLYFDSIFQQEVKRENDLIEYQVSLPFSKNIITKTISILYKEKDFNAYSLFTFGPSGIKKAIRVLEAMNFLSFDIETSKIVASALIEMISVINDEEEKKEYVKKLCIESSVHEIFKHNTFSLYGNTLNIIGMKKKMSCSILRHESMCEGNNIYLSSEDDLNIFKGIKFTLIQSIGFDYNSTIIEIKGEGQDENVEQLRGTITLTLFNGYDRPFTKKFGKGRIITFPSNKDNYYYTETIDDAEYADIKGFELVFTHE